MGTHLIPLNCFHCTINLTEKEIQTFKNYIIAQKVKSVILT